MKEAEHQMPMAIPYLFRCPISLDLFKDPVTLCTGQTYDRSSIEKWLSAGNLTCPVTMQKLHDPTIVPNHTLRHLIHQWLQFGHQFDSDYLETIQSLSSLKHILESNDSSLDSKLEALNKIQVLSQESSSSSSRNSCLLQLGFMPLLLELVFGKLEAQPSEDYIKVVEQALFCIIKLLSLGEFESLNALKEESKFLSFLFLFTRGTSVVKMNLCLLIEAISSSTETKQLCAMLGKSNVLLQEIFGLVVTEQNGLASDSGIRAIWAFCSLELNIEFLIRGGIMDALIEYISGIERRERSLAAMAMATIEKLLGVESGKEALIKNPNAMKALVKMVFRVSDHQGSESAIESLMILCHGCLQAREEAISAGVLTQLLLLLQSQCSGRTKTKARMLLKLLRSKWNEDPKHV